MSNHSKKCLFPVAIKRAPDALGIFEGYASTFGGEPDSHGDVVARGAFAQSIQDHTAARTMPAMLWGHDPSEPIGVFTSMVEDAFGLKVTGKLTLGVKRGQEAFALMKDGALAMSIGYRTRKSRALPRGGRILQDIDLVEVSAVALPSNPSSRITGIKSDFDPTEIKTARDYERLLLQLGFSRAFAKTAVASGFDAANRRPPHQNRAELARKMRALAGALSRKG